MLQFDPVLVVFASAMVFLFAFGVVQLRMDAREAKRIEEERTRRR